MNFGHRERDPLEYIVGPQHFIDRHPFHGVVDHPSVCPIRHLLAVCGPDRWPGHPF